MDEALTPDGFDIVIIGGGPAGYVGAIRATQLGAKTALVERDTVGGTCLNRGCIPTKALLEGVSYLRRFQRAKTLGFLVGEASLDYNRLQNWKNETVAALVDGVRGLLADDGVEIIEGTGRLLSPTRIQVTDAASQRTLETGKVVVATGSLPMRPGIPGVGSRRVLNSDEALALEAPPESLAIIGGGVVGVEIATIFAGLGTKVTVFEMITQILPGEDADIAAGLSERLRQSGIDVMTGARVLEIVDGPGMIQVVAAQGGTERRVEAAYVLIATGRRPNVQGLGLEEMGLRLNAGAVAVDETMQTEVPGIYAAGDIVGGLMLAHVASRQGIVAVENALGQRAIMRYAGVPRCIYTFPEVASVGLTDKQAIEQGYEVCTGISEFLANGRSRVAGETEGFVKVVVDRQYDELLGVHILGPHATELIGQASLALTAELSAEMVRANIAAHPTFSEALSEALADSAARAIHVPRWSASSY